MKKRPVWIGILFGLFVLGYYQPAQAEDPKIEARAVFTEVDTPEEKSTGKTSVTMVKEIGQWKFGKPRSE